MLRAAVLGTLAEVQAGFFRVEHDQVGVAGNQIDLAAEPRHPKAVADVGRLQSQIRRAASVPSSLAGMCSSLAVMKPSVRPS